MTLDYTGKVVIVTGAGGGLGRCHALEFARRGAKVVVNDLGGSVDGSGGSSEAADKVVEEIKAAGGEAMSNGSSVTDDAGVANMVSQTMDAYGRIDVLVNNAGVTRFAHQKDLAALNAADFEHIMSVNVTGSYQMTRAAVPDLEKSDCAAVVNVSSHSGISGIGSSMAYAASKGALNTMTLSLARNLAPSIRVNAVCPGFVDTKWLSGKLSDEALAAFKEKVAAVSPLQTIVTPADVADAVCWLGLKARSVTGQLLVIDGGTHLTTASPL